MGCHSWTYKKVSSLSKEEKNEILIDLYNKETSSLWPFTSKREEYAKELSMMCKGKDGYSIEECRKIWDKYQENKKIWKDRIDNYIINKSDSNEFVDIYLFMNKNSADIREHNGEYYYLIGFDLFFRCYRYGDGIEPLDSYDKVIDYVSVNPDLVVFYPNNSIENEICGVSDDLKIYLMELFENNDVFVEFG